MIRNSNVHTAFDAVLQPPSLGALVQKLQESQQRLQCLSTLLPPNLYRALQAGPLEGESWCLLVANAAVAAKLRQLSPSILAHLRSQGFSVQTLRVVVSTTSSS